ncbi:MAG: uroporphyrinogen-III C-methyltransferase [Puia sp.]|nr:uroporphyrinogen-III C-methyltransferase [Puia sp.]
MNSRLTPEIEKEAGPEKKLILLGAGPGDKELITLKGYKILREARVVLYDNLANKELLDFTPPDCEKIYVGKTPYGAYTSQDAIHALILEKTRSKGEVVRLKGGDPFVFGRGFEEVLYAREHGIGVIFVPGITSMQSAGLEGIPLTHREVSESIWVVTGTKKDGRLSDDLRLAMQSKATVVVYMGMKKLPEIAAAYLAEGLGDTPAAIIQHATLPQQKTAKGTAQNLPAMASLHQLTHPSIVVIGQVVNMADGL